MKSVLLATVTILSLGLAGTAGAADLPARTPVYKAPMAAPAPVYNWTGFYIMGGGGYGLFDAEATTLNTAGAPVSLTVDNGGRGYFGTVGGGFDFQFDKLVLGVFGDVDFSSIKGNFEGLSGAGVGSLKQNSAWAVGGRIGWLVTPTVLSYFNGGYAQSHFRGLTYSANGAAVFVSPPIVLAAQTYSGYFLGGGVEYNLGWFPGLFVKTEYRLAKYSSRNVPDINAVPATISFENIKPVVQTVRTELIWRFNWF
jgi:outer membrane immunogenic protein